MATYVRGSNPIWFMVDLTSNHFDDTFYMFVLQNDLPYLPATTYTGPNGENPTTDPIQFLANGTLPINIFFDADPTLVYRLEFRQGNTQSDPLIYLVENYTPGEGGGDVVTFELTTDNQISNPQFSLINFVSPYTITGGSAQDIEVAPGWVLELTGTGNLTLTQTPLVGTGDTLNPTNAPYALRIALVGWSTAVLRQRFQQNGMLWANKTVSSSITARMESTSVANLIGATLVASDTTVLGTVLPATTALTTAFDQYTGHADLGATTNTDVPPAAYIDYRLNLPGSCDLYVTSFQLVAGSVSAFEPKYEQTTIDRQIDQTFHYFKPQLEFKPIPSLLTGWDFPLNPAQAKGTTVTVPTSASVPSAVNCYAWDQTISNSLVASIAVVRNAVTGGFQATTASADEAFYMIQYLTGNEAKEILGTRLSVNVNAFRTQAGGAVTCQVYLYSGRSAATFPALPTMIGTVAASGAFTLTAANWTLIPRSNLGPATGTLSTVDTADYTTLNDVVDLKFNGWELTDTAQIADTDKFAIVVTFSCPTTATVVVVDSISMVKGDIPTRPAALTLAQTLINCSYYYQKSFAPGTVPATAAGIPNSTYSLQGSNAAGAAGPLINFKTTMRVAPSAATGIVLYNPVNANNEIYNAGAGADWALSTVAGSSNGVQGFATSGTPPAGTGNFAIVHWTADARLGII